MSGLPRTSANAAMRSTIPTQTIDITIALGTWRAASRVSSATLPQASKPSRTQPAIATAATKAGR